MCRLEMENTQSETAVVIRRVFRRVGWCDKVTYEDATLGTHLLFLERRDGGLDFQLFWCFVFIIKRSDLSRLSLRKGASLFARRHQSRCNLRLNTKKLDILRRTMWGCAPQIWLIVATGVNGLCYSLRSLYEIRRQRTSGVLLYCLWAPAVNVYVENTIGYDWPSESLQLLRISKLCTMMNSTLSSTNSWLRQTGDSGGTF